MKLDTAKAIEAEEAEFDALAEVREPTRTYTAAKRSGCPAFNTRIGDGKLARPKAMACYRALQGAV